MLFVALPSQHLTRGEVLHFRLEAAIYFFLYFAHQASRGARRTK
jgi:hypothetical protein